MTETEIGAASPARGSARKERQLVSLTSKPSPATQTSRPEGRTACVRTFGCQMNVHDSDRMRRMVLDAGYAEVQRYEDADVVILNTCYVRENAVDRVRGHLGELNRLKREGRVKKVALAGCIGAAEESSELKEQYGLDLVIGTHNTYELASFVGLPTMEETYTPELPGTVGEHSAFVTIMTGCNYQCSYCIVPSVRGRMVCRPLDNVVAEVERLVASGTEYITLLGQTVDAWRHEGLRFYDLLKRVSEVAPRVWFTTSHPSNMEDRTLRLIGESETIVRRLHLPVQSGSDRLLKVMHRGYKSERYRRKVEVFRESVPDGTLSTDLIIGHPGETEADHEATLRLVEECGFDSAYIFKYSPRRGTEGAEMHERGEAVPEDVVQRRFLQVLRAVEQNAFRQNQAKVGSEEEIFIRHGVSDSGKAIGETWSGHSVHVGPEVLSPKTGLPPEPGEYVRAKILSAGPHVLYA
ncbi:TIGR00089: radical SAM methylthiotransferase, MiaB/RimO family [Rubrobacter radiotolerans]|uniref:tRNA-2-methylthio-N(6)-dimethylallyladenosine synthase n=1 Tax=Rubrobacter radiotolerans TaxID=42256 RepID=A0A023X3F3_RUBRA|nr:MiaB/RimO family radical SAM methylthiotransferase [Rubrobacter radiotolerans]AHY46716.1 TIGR00089: radical SAM methylthiotransferase, MiaB/RimO family [Rubrobacter radiotolerans]MDX5894123.1 MiaB/RimO family radical SAM methylthiotransferase [Rubrobacter radiotolerans]SMC05259.1 tRNA-2-methylthio-N6-dimethylallyladenosine synthase [Rubrobacter radiotolerans DSM 5868]